MRSIIRDISVEIFNLVRNLSWKGESISKMRSISQERERWISTLSFPSEIWRKAAGPNIFTRLNLDQSKAVEHYYIFLYTPQIYSWSFFVYFLLLVPVAHRLCSVGGAEVEQPSSLQGGESYVALGRYSRFKPLPYGKPPRALFSVSQKPKPRSVSHNQLCPYRLGFAKMSIKLYKCNQLPFISI